jgi:hypothetical protein
VTIAGFYFGKTGGLLGVYDNEPANDFMTPTRKPANDESAFISSWRVEEADAGRGDLNCGVDDIVTSVADAADKRNCRRLFTASQYSALMPCFDTVNPAPFLELCLLDGASPSSSGFCRSASAYVELCRLRQIELWLPGSCVTCRNHDGSRTLTGGETLSYRDGEEPAPSAADIVFVVQQSKCIKSVELGDLPMWITRSLPASQTDIKFAVVGFGGPVKFKKPQSFVARGTGLLMNKENSAVALKK